MLQKETPFGMLFEEQAPTPPKFILRPEYDPNENISFIISACGECIPYIQGRWATLETQTATLVKAETSDSDQEPLPLGTETVTNVQAESSDDDKPRLELGTETATKVRAETSDSDQEHWHIYAGTQTFTEVKAETTDTD